MSWLTRLCAPLRPQAWPLPGACWTCLAWGRDRICPDCRRTFAAPQSRCQGCALRLPEGSTTPLCGHCVKAPLGLDACWAAVDFQPPWDGLLHALKYRSQTGTAAALAELLADTLPRAQPIDAILPVPLHEARLRTRGHNPSALLAQALARPWQLPVREDCVLRVRDTPSQTRLDRSARQRNLREAFALAPQAEVRGQHLLLVDDVLTTGATLAALAQLLRRHGAASIQACVVARTPDPHA